MKQDQDIYGRKMMVPETAWSSVEFEDINGTQWKADLNLDVGYEDGTLWVELYRWSDDWGLDGDRDDDLCVYPDSCDLDDEEAVIEYLRDYVNEYWSGR